MKYQVFNDNEILKTDEAGPLRRFDLLGRNDLRRIEFTQVVFASHAGAAIGCANAWRRDNNKVRAESWRCTPAY